MVLFLDTSIFIRHATSIETEHDKAVTILKDNQWITSQDVVDELQDVNRRRKEIYNSIIGYEFGLGATFKGFYDRGFMSKCKHNFNDRAHVDRMFRYAFQKCGFNWDEEIDADKLSRFNRAIYRSMTSTKIELGKIIKNFTDPTFRGIHVIDGFSPTADNLTLQNLLKTKLPMYISHRGDIKILTIAILHGYYAGESVIFRSTHGFFNGNKNIIEETVKQSYPDHLGFEVKSMDDIKIMKDTTLSSVRFT